MGGSQSSALADAIDKMSKVQARCCRSHCSLTRALQLPLGELSSSVFTALYAHDADMWSALTVDNIRELKKLPDGFARLIALLRHVHHGLCSIAQLPAVTPALSVHARNCCHLIARVCPVLFEQCSVEQVDEMFWLPSASADVPLGRALLDVCLELMFLPQFCCSSSSQIWSQGLGSFVPKPQILDPALNSNRHAVVLALLGLCSLPLFISTSDMTAKGNRFVSYLVSVDSIMAQLVFRSLLNVVLCYDAVGWGIPFGGLISSGATNESFVSSCCQLLLILLDTSEELLQLHASTAGYSAVATAEDEAPRSLNMVLNDLTDICDPRDFEFMFTSILTLLTNPLMASSSSIPGAITSISFFQETIILLWKLLDLHPAFTPFILRNFDVAQLVVPLVFFINEGRKDSAKAGLIHICTFVILLLSGQRNFSIALNAPFNVKLPTDLPAFSGNVGDLVVIVLSRLVLEHTLQMIPLFDCFFTIISNIRRASTPANFPASFACCSRSNCRYQRLHQKLLHDQRCQAAAGSSSLSKLLSPPLTPSPPLLVVFGFFTSQNFMRIWQQPPVSAAYSRDYQQHHPIPVSFCAAFSCRPLPRPLPICCRVHTHAPCRYEGNPSVLLQIISKAKDFEALQTLGAAAKDAAPSPRTSLDAQQAEAASVVAAAAASAATSGAVPRASSADVSSDIPPFEATDEWLCALRDSLPLEPSARVLHHLQVQPPPPLTPLHACDWLPAAACAALLRRARRARRGFCCSVPQEHDHGAPPHSCMCLHA
jgi:hypothetical protein